jgi:hypothetical protein
VRKSGLYESVNHPSTVEYRDSIPDAVEVSTWLGQGAGKGPALRSEPQASEGAGQ